MYNKNRIDEVRFFIFLSVLFEKIIHIKTIEIVKKEQE